ncbi:hypothetical protein [Frigoribacterium faeni]|nr:hypothetical protein [Frigoribacterium faeni]
MENARSFMNIGSPRRGAATIEIEIEIDPSMLLHGARLAVAEQQQQQLG